MTEIGIERLAAGNREKYQAERHQPNMAMGENKLDGVSWIDCYQHPGIIANVQSPGDRDRDEPDRHDGSKKCRNPRGPAPLHGKKCKQDGDCQRQHDVLGSRHHELQSLDRGEDGDGRRDHGIAKKHRSSDHAEAQDRDCPVAQRSRRERGQRQRSALPVVIGAQEDQHVFERDDDNQRPQNERENAENDAARERRVVRGCDGGLPECVERTCTDIAINDANAAECERNELGRAVRHRLSG